jgi:hypothetical protein
MMVGDKVKVLGITRQGEMGIIIEQQLANVYKVKMSDGEELLYNGLSLEEMQHEAFIGHGPLRMDLSAL